MLVKNKMSQTVAFCFLRCFGSERSKTEERKRREQPGRKGVKTEISSVKEEDKLRASEEMKKSRLKGAVSNCVSSKLALFTTKFIYQVSQ